jgi:hypothetical protein
MKDRPGNPWCMTIVRRVISHVTCAINAGMSGFGRRRVDLRFLLAALVHPLVVERVIEAYWEENRDEPKIFTIELASTMLALARGVGRIPCNGVSS